MANPFQITPPNALQALLMGVQGYDRAQKSAQQQAMQAARQEAGNLYAQGGDTRGALGRLIGLGDSDTVKAIASMQPKANPEIEKLRALQADPSLMQTAAALKQAGATRINNSVNTSEGFAAAQTKARIGIDTDAAKEAGKQALAANRLTPLLDQVESLATKTPGGWAGPVSAGLARMATSLGMEVPEGWSNAELLQSISQRLVPIVREPGPTSEKEIALYLKAVPGLMQSPEGRLKVVKMTRSINERAKAIARVYRQHVGSPDLYDRLAELDKPLFDQRDLSGAQSASGAPQVGEVRQGYRYKGGDPANPDSWAKL